jgi:hypothetical protein
MSVWGRVALWVYELGALATFAKLLFFSGFVYNAWNWLIAIPASLFLAQIWPIYWLIVRPLFG